MHRGCRGRSKSQLGYWDEVPYANPRAWSGPVGMNEEMDRSVVYTPFRSSGSSVGTSSFQSTYPNPFLCASA